MSAVFGSYDGQLENTSSMSDVADVFRIHWLWLIDTKLAVWVAYIKTQLGIATQVSVIKVKVTVPKKNSVSAQ